MNRPPRPFTSSWQAWQQIHSTQEAVTMQTCTRISVPGPQCTAYLAAAGAASWSCHVEHRGALLGLLNLQCQHSARTSQ